MWSGIIARIESEVIGMMPDTALYSRRKLMFLIVGGRYYNTSNPREADKDYLTLCGLKFPLSGGGTLEEEETGYMRRNARVIDELRNDLEKKVNNNKESLRELEEDIRKKRDILFFLRDVCIDHAWRPSADRVQDISMQLNPFYDVDDGAILPKILPKDYAVINGRMYPLVHSEQPVFVSLNGVNYTLSSGEKTVTQANSAFKEMLSQRLYSQVMQRCSKVKDMEQERQDLGRDIETRMKHLNISLYKHAMEWNNEGEIIGFDVTSQFLYCLVAPHYNQTTNRQYGEGQSAAVIPLQYCAIGTAGKFAERKDRDSQFVFPSHNQCHGDLRLDGQSITDKLMYIRELAHEIETNQAFYQISMSSDSSDSYNSY